MAVCLFHCVTFQHRYGGGATVRVESFLKDVDHSYNVRPIARLKVVTVTTPPYILRLSLTSYQQLPYHHLQSNQERYECLANIIKKSNEVQTLGALRMRSTAK